MDFCDMVWKLRSSFFAKDRDITLATGRSIFLADGTEVPASALVPVGGIILWSGSVASIPTGWQLANGTNGTPNLTDRFVVGAGNSYAVADTGGSDSVDLEHNHGGNTGNESSHTHNGGTLGADSDSHSHGYGTLATGVSLIDTEVQSGTGTIVASRYHTHDVTSGSTASDSHTHTVSGATASGSAHKHTISNSLSATTENRPAFYALAYIQRLS